MTRLHCVLAGYAIVTASVLATESRPAMASEGYVAFDGMLQKWSFDTTTNTYSLIGNAASAVTPGLVGSSSENHRVLELEVNPVTGDVYTQGSDNLIRRWTFDGTSLTQIGQRSNSGGRGLAFADDNSIYALNGVGFLPALDPTGFVTPSTDDNTPVPVGGGPEQLVKFSQDLSTEPYGIGVNGNDIIHSGGGNVYVAANDGDGQIFHFQDTGTSWTNVSLGAPFWGGTIAKNPMTDKYASAHGLDKSTGLHIPRQNQFPPEQNEQGFSAPAWIITGSLATIDSGTWDAGNTGNGIDYVNDMEIGPDGTIFATFGANIGATSTWIMAWKDRGPAQTPQLVSGVGNSDSRGAWLAVDENGTIIHTATNDGGATVLRAWTWDPNGSFATALSFLTQLSLPGEMEEIALISTPVPPTFTADFDDDNDVDAADLTVWRNSFGGAGADADSDGDSDGADFLAWQRELGSPSSMAAARAVPEPTALLLLMIGLASLATSRRRS